MFDAVEIEIERVISDSEVAEDPVHAKNTREWVLRLNPEADAALQIAALAHDIERSVKQRKVNRRIYNGYDEFKRAHAANSARILREILLGHGVAGEVIEKATELVRLHEFGGTPEADILKDADGISFFEVNLPLYFMRNTREETAFRMKWGFERLSDDAKLRVRAFSYGDSELQALYEGTIMEDSGSRGGTG